MTRIEVDDVLGAARKWLDSAPRADRLARDAGSVPGA
jgi:hypothetical protein